MQTPQPITVVTGLGRCGTTMVMHMLKAGGYPIFADSPDGGLECDRTTRLPKRHNWLQEAQGHALKVIDPQIHTIPAQYEARYIICTRDLEQQARSQIKFHLAMSGKPVPKPYRINADAVKALMEDLEIDQLTMFRMLKGNVIVLPFEYILDKPFTVAKSLRAFVQDLDFDVDQAAAVVRTRSPKCAHGLEIEVSLCQEDF